MTEKGAVRRLSFIEARVMLTIELIAFMLHHTSHFRRCLIAK